MSCLACPKERTFCLEVHSALNIEKRFSPKALSKGIQRLDMDGIMTYYEISLKYVCAVR